MPPKEILDFTPFEIISEAVLGVNEHELHKPSSHSRCSQKWKAWHSTYELQQPVETVRYSITALWRAGCFLLQDVCLVNLTMQKNSS